MFQGSESPAFWFQPAWGLHFLWSVCNRPPPQGGGLISAEQLKDSGRLLSKSLLEESEESGVL